MYIGWRVNSKSASSVVTQLCYHGSEECERDV